ncbi:MAG: 50S ribosomal protein L5 [Halobacteriovoraceae bacterium]|nr:50S ribosomal protein L5 [Halobacteriovoraceae bacterium]
MSNISRLRNIYEKNVIPLLMEKFKYKNKHMVPKIKKVVVNCCSRDCLSNSKIVESLRNDLAAITGQRPVIARAKKSVASFKLRQGQALGVTVTLRGKIMYEFLDRLINISLPRVRDFRGISPKSFDGKGNFAMGLAEQIIFPEINYDKIDKIRGLGIAVETTATNNNEGFSLLSELGMPFKTQGA